MNTPLRTRLAALLVAMLFLLSGAGDVLGAHPCPHHAAIGAPAHADAQAAHGEHGHAAHDPAPAAPEGHDGHAACTCAGVCPLGTGPAPLAAPATLHLAILVATAAPAAPLDDPELPGRLVPHFLPFAQAPPPSA